VLESANYRGQRGGWWASDEQVDVVGFTVHLDEFVLVVRADAWEHSKLIQINN
jgi:hypothetical protein